MGPYDNHFILVWITFTFEYLTMLFCCIICAKLMNMASENNRNKIVQLIFSNINYYYNLHSMVLKETVIEFCMGFIYVTINCPPRVSHLSGLDKGVGK